MSNFPLIYCNGDSYSNENYHPLLPGKVYPNVVAEYCNGFVINSAISGSSNRRIIRTTMHDVIEQRKLNPTQQIIALIGLSFDLRSEIWVNDITTHIPAESNFKTHTFSEKITWREDLLNGVDIDTNNRYNLDKKFFDSYSKGRAYFFSPYAERINLLTDLIMLRAVLESISVDFLIFQSPKAEILETEYLKDFLNNEILDDPRFFDLEEFGFCDWCYSEKFIPLDLLDRPNIGHYGPDAHRAFAEKILIPKLRELQII